MLIKNKKTIKYQGPVHDLEIQNSHSYNVEGLAVHNSSGGSLIAHLMKIVAVNPLEFDLLFERFYSASRNTEGNVSLPDIDVDVPTIKRDEIIEHMKDMYGHDKVGQMITLGTLRGRSAIKEVLRVNDSCGFAEMNAITKPIPDEAMISDQLEEMGDEKSIIRWALLNKGNELSPFCQLLPDGTLKGEYASEFDQAIRLEGTIKSFGKHAAGVVVTTEPLNRVCPMNADKKGGDRNAGLEMNDLEALGHVKFDILGNALLSKLMRIQELLIEYNE